MGSFVVNQYKLLEKQSWGQWFDTIWRSSLWRHCRWVRFEKFVQNWWRMTSHVSSITIIANKLFMFSFEILIHHSTSMDIYCRYDYLLGKEWTCKTDMIDYRYLLANFLPKNDMIRKFYCPVKGWKIFPWISCNISVRGVFKLNELADQAPYRTIPAWVQAPFRTCTFTAVNTPEAHAAPDATQYHSLINQT